MNYLLAAPFILQGCAIGFDEFYFHVKRGLPRWERYGHPIDTASLLACLLFILILPQTAKNNIIYLSLSIFSCLCITKDEWVHKHHCNAKEQWLHALLFLNHSLLLFTLYQMWTQREAYHIFLIVQVFIVVLFLIYQVVFWNFIWKKK